MSVVPDPPAGEAIYTERRFTLQQVQLSLRDGRTEPRGMLLHGGAVVLLAYTDAGELVFIHNRRWAVGQRLFELPAGTLSPGEDPAVCAARELIEETGYAAGRLSPIQSMFALPAMSTEVMHVFEAHDLRFVGQQLEADEDIEVELVPIAEVRRRLRAGEIVDMKTLAVLARALL